MRTGFLLELLEPDPARTFSHDDSHQYVVQLLPGACLACA